MTATRIKLLVIYGYGIEAVLAGLVSIFIWQNGFGGSVVKFIEASASSWAVIFGIMLTGGMAARLIFFSLNSGDFSTWLEWKKFGGIVAGVFLSNLLTFLVLTIVSVVLVYLKGSWLSYAAIFGFVYGMINAVTFPIFVYRLGRLQAVFNLEYKKAIEAEKNQK